MSEYILITGGAGYIGSCVNAMLNTLGFRTIVVDSLVYGHKEALDFSLLDSADSNILEFFKKANLDFTSTEPNLTNPKSNTAFIKADLCDKDALEAIFEKHKISCVLHFAAFAYVSESVANPAKYYTNNVANTLNLLESMRKFGVKHIIFSSTCATYGNPLELPITESHPQNPINPYGRSKLIVEQILADFANAYGLRYIALRYFNAAGASNFFDIGESHSPETHLIPLILQTALKKRECFSIFGRDYDTQDGSCVRDFIHIDDLSAAHILALDYLTKHSTSDVFNLGNGSGFSVLEVLECARKITRCEIPTKYESRREGDPAKLVGSAKKAKEILGWNPIFYDLESILKSAFAWHKNARY